MAKAKPQGSNLKTQGAALKTSKPGREPRRGVRRPPAVPHERVHAPGFLRAALLVALAAVIVYVNGIPGGFVFDDKLILRDARIHGQTGLWTIFVTDYWYTYIGTSADLYRPLTIASYALNYAVAGLNAPAFHVVNVLLHAVFCVMVVALVEALLHERPVAVVAGVLFATHPVHSEAVTGIVGRAEILTGLFLLFALYLHARRYRLSGWGQAVWLPVSLFSYFCALLSKETAIVGLGLLLLIDYGRAAAALSRARWRERRAGEEMPHAPSGADAGGWNVRRTLAVVALYAAVALAYVAIRYAVVGQFIQKPPARSYLLLFGQPWSVRVLTAFQVLAVYLRLLFFPLTLSADYSYRHVPLLQAPNAAAVVGIVAAVVLCGAFAWALRRRAVAALCALGFFAVAYSLIGNFFIPLQILVAERLMYLPSVGFCIGLAWVLVRGAQAVAVPARMEARTLCTALAGVVVLFYSVRTVVRNFDWRDNETLYGATVRDAPECFAAHFNYAAVLMMRDPAKNELALRHLLRAYEIRQDHYPSLVNLSSMYLRLGQAEKAREFAVRGLEIRPDGREIRALLESAEAQLRRQVPEGSTSAGEAPRAAR